MKPPNPTTPPELAERLRNVHVALRADLDVTRHVFRGEPAYIVHDPITFQSHQLTPEDYRLFVAIDARHTLGEICARLRERGELATDQEETFYRFVFTLHRLGFLNLPISDDKLLFRRYQSRRQARVRSRWMALFSLQIPVCNPDAMLTRTLPYARWLFTRWFFACWLLLLGAAGFVAFRSWNALVEPVQGLLLTQNLPLLWLVLIGLKVAHELGHGYACKHFGGHVPEMGVYLILLTPCAYVDATAAWGFTRRRDRLIVSLAGVYVELTIAALAVFVWAATEPSLLNAIACNVIFLASATTLLFNINPLMRYDGYYIASDLLEIPNLRRRAMQYVTGVLRRIFLGLRGTDPPLGPRLAGTLFTFGVAATLYRVTVVLGLSYIVAQRFLLLGVAIGAAFIGMMLYGTGRRLCAYLWWDPQTQAVRGRAVALSVLLLVGVPAGILTVPIPWTVCAAGMVRGTEEAVVRVAGGGFLEDLHFVSGTTVAAAAPLAVLQDMTRVEAVLQAEAVLRAAHLRASAAAAVDAAQAQQEAARVGAAEAALKVAQARLAELALAAPVSGAIVTGVSARDLGRYLQPGEPVALIAHGGWSVHVLLTTAEFVAAQPAVGDAVEFRPRCAPHAVLAGVITRVGPAASRTIEHRALTQIAGGTLTVDATTGHAAEPYVEVLIRLATPMVADVEKNALPEVPYGLTGTVRFAAPGVTLGRVLQRRVLSLLDHVRLS